MLKTSLKILSLSLAIAVVSGCSNSENNDSQKKEQVKIPYQWLEGDWKGELYLHDDAEDFPAEVKYHNGTLEIFAQKYCKGKATFLSTQNKQELTIQCGENTFMLSPANKEGKIYDINNTENKLINAVYIQHFEGTKFAGFLGKE